MFLCNGIGSYKDHEPIKISLHITDVLSDQLKYRICLCALKMGNKVAGLIDEVHIGAKGPVALAIAPTEIRCTVIEDLMIPAYH
jgi:hypothetical protein